MSKQEGYTLVEVLVVLFLFGVIVVVAGNLFMTVFKGGNKIEITKEVKQNGDYAMGIMERTIRNAKSVSTDPLSPVCNGSTSNVLEVTSQENNKTYFQCVRDSTNNIARLASSSAYLQIPLPSSSNVFLTGNNTSLTLDVNGLCSGDLSFTCISTTGSPPTVKISYTLYQRGAAGLRADEKASVKFESTISLRTY